MTVLVTTVSARKGWVTQDSLWPGVTRGLKGLIYRLSVACVAKLQDHQSRSPYRVVDGKLMRRKLRTYETARMIVGMSGNAAACVRIRDAAEGFADCEAFAAAVPALWKQHRPPADYTQVSIVGWSERRRRVIEFEFYYAPGAELTIAEHTLGTKLDDDPDPAGLHYREILRLAQFAKPDPTDEEIEHLHMLVAENIYDASRRGHYGSPFAAGPLDMATVTREGITVRQLDLDARTAA